MGRIKGIDLSGLVVGQKKKTRRSLGVNDRHILYIRDRGRCKGCGKRISEAEMQVGHKKAYSKGGATTLTNSVLLCYKCNKLQGTGSLETLKKKLAGTYGKRTKKTSKEKIKNKKEKPDLAKELGVTFSKPAKPKDVFKW